MLPSLLFVLFCFVLFCFVLFVSLKGSEQLPQHEILRISCRFHDLLHPIDQIAPQPNPRFKYYLLSLSVRVGARPATVPPEHHAPHVYTPLTKLPQWAHKASSRPCCPTRPCPAPPPQQLLQDLIQVLFLEIFLFETPIKLNSATAQCSESEHVQEKSGCGLSEKNISPKGGPSFSVPAQASTAQEQN